MIVCAKRFFIDGGGMKKVMLLFFYASVIHSCPTWVGRLQSDGLQSCHKKTMHDDHSSQEQGSQSHTTQPQEDEQ